MSHRPKSRKKMGKSSKYWIVEFHFDRRRRARQCCSRFLSRSSPFGALCKNQPTQPFPPSVRARLKYKDVLFQGASCESSSPAEPATSVVSLRTTSRAPDTPSPCSTTSSWDGVRPCPPPQSLFTPTPATKPPSTRFSTLSNL